MNFELLYFKNNNEEQMDAILHSLVNKTVTINLAVTLTIVFAFTGTLVKQVWDESSYSFMVGQPLQSITFAPQDVLEIQESKWNGKMDTFIKLKSFNGHPSF
jgi:hypothetical protein